MLLKHIMIESVPFVNKQQSEVQSPKSEVRSHVIINNIEDKYVMLLIYNKRSRGD